jgi:hypothetical protein
MDHTNYNMVDPLQLKGPVNYLGQRPINLIYTNKKVKNPNFLTSLASSRDPPAQAPSSTPNSG